MLVMKDIKKHSVSHYLMKKLILISALLLVTSNGWAQEPDDLVYLTCSCLVSGTIEDNSYTNDQCRASELGFAYSIKADGVLFDSQEINGLSIGTLMIRARNESHLINLNRASLVLQKHLFWKNGSVTSEDYQCRVVDRL